MKFYTSDQHFDHFNIISLCGRPFDTLLDMQNCMINNWNNLVSQSDDVYILGDFCFNYNVFMSIASKLNGVKHFISGNHDSEAHNRAKKMDMVKCVFHPHIHNIVDNGKRLVLCHYPLYEWEGFYKGAIHLHGHIHREIDPPYNINVYNVCVDVRDFKPVTLEEILK